MPRGIYKRTLQEIEDLKKVSNKTRFEKGHLQYNTGRTYFKKGHNTWNKGLTKEIDKRIKKYSENRNKTMNEKQIMKHLWQNPEYREKIIKNSLKGLFKRPTSLEQKFIELIKKYNLPYKYVGNGSFLIGFKNPDFVNVNGEKICIEVANHFHHQNNYAEKRKEYFQKWGWKCLVFFGNKYNNYELTEQEILKVMK